MSETGERLRDLFTEIAPPIDLERIVATTWAPPRARRGWLVAVAAAAGVLVVGMGAFLLVSGAPAVDDSAMSSPLTTVAPPTTVSPVTTSGVPGVSTAPGGWCGVGSPPESIASAAGESVAWALDGSKWGIGAFPPNAWPNFELLQHLPDGRVVSHPLPAIEDFDVPSWAPQGLEGMGDLGPFDLEVTAAGQVWLSHSGSWGWGGVPAPSGVLRYDPESSTWENIEMVPGRTVPVSGIEATCDGSLWVLVIDWALGDEGDVSEVWWLGHIDANGVNTRIDVDLVPGTVPEVPDVFWGADPDLVDGPPMVVRADDRAVWVMNGRGVPTVGSGVFSGVARYDGEEWTRFLDGEIVGELTLHDDGTATADFSGTPETVLIEP